MTHFYEEILDGLDRLYKIVNDEMFKSLYQGTDFGDEDIGINKFKIAASYLCDTYQIERNIIRNRREMLEGLPERKLIALPYQLDPDKNFYEYRVYQDLVSWITEEELSEGKFNDIFRPLFGAFFSSPWAFKAALDQLKEKTEIPDNIVEDEHRWEIYEQDIADRIVDALDTPDDYSSRILRTLYYLDENVGDSKIVLFTNYQETFDMYKEILTSFYTEDGFSCFRKGMGSDDLELNVCRFQNDRTCTIMLCDESGGEGRNFQCADYVVHIDLPWDANAIEQRIGRLDRLGREGGRPIISIVPYAEESLEEELFRFWNEGLKIFEHSLSGLEIIMNDINKAIVSAIINDFKFGLVNEIQNVIDRSSKLKEEVQEEQHFDTSAYIYRPMNQELISLVKYYNRNENQLFADAMLQWAELSGFKDVKEKDDVISFNESSFSTRSAKNSLLIPPNWNLYFAEKQNQFLLKIIEMRQDGNAPRSKYDVRKIDGTFSRKKAIENDYIHFFAPGDDIFDCIVDNAMRSCRGQSSAFAMKADINWTGFVYTWSLYPNELLLIENDIPLSYLSSFRNYLAIEQAQIPVRLSADEDVSDDKVIREFNTVLEQGIESSKDDIDHLGRRGINGGFLGIYNRYRSSNIDYFKARYPQEQWEDNVIKSREISRDKAMKKLGAMSHIANAKAEMERLLTSEIATAKYYGQEPSNYERLKRIYDIVLESIKKPRIRLGSACFVWMVRTK